MSLDAASPLSDATLASASRPRSQIACVSCRRRKIKCNGDLRGCNHCKGGPHTCRYEPVSEDQKQKARSYKRRLRSLKRQYPNYMDVYSTASQVSADYNISHDSSTPSEPSTSWTSAFPNRDQEPDMLGLTSGPCSSMVPRVLNSYFWEPHQGPLPEQASSNLAQPQLLGSPFASSMPWMHDEHASTSSAPVSQMIQPQLDYSRTSNNEDTLLLSSPCTSDSSFGSLLDEFDLDLTSSSSQSAPSSGWATPAATQGSNSQDLSSWQLGLMLDWLSTATECSPQQATNQVQIAAVTSTTATFPEPATFRPEPQAYSDSTGSQLWTCHPTYTAFRSI